MWYALVEMGTLKEATKWVRENKGMEIRDYVAGRLRAGATVTSLADELQLDRTLFYKAYLPKWRIKLQRAVIVDEV